MPKYYLTSQPTKVEVKVKAIDEQTMVHTDRDIDLLGQTRRPSVIENIHPIGLGFSHIRIHWSFDG